MFAAEKSFYEVLGVKRSATAQDIDTAYARLRAALQHAPVAADARRSAILKVAYTTLSDPEARAEYDESIGNKPRPTRASDLLLYAAGALVVAGLAAFGWRWHENRKLAASPENGVDVPRLVSDVGRRIAHVKAALVSGEVRPLGLAVETGDGEMAAACGELPSGTALTVAGPKDAMRAEIVSANPDNGLCILGVAAARAGLRMREGIPPPDEALQAVVRMGDRVAAREVAISGRMPAPAGALGIKADEPLPNGTPVFDMREHLVGLVVAGQGASFAAPASSLRIREPKR
jgi:hypothetical protein